MSPLDVGELVALGLCVLVLAVVVLTWWRRRAIGSQWPVALCALRLPGSARWRLGLLRLGPTQLDWFGIFGFTRRATHRWQREGLEISTPHTEHVLVPGLSGPVALSLSDAGGAPLADIAIERPLYMALRSWLESAPPGRGVNVA